MTISRNSCDNVIIWHARLWHIGQERLNRLVKENLLCQLTKIDMPTCKYCLVNKKRKNHSKKGIKVETPLQLIHYDIYGPVSVRARHDSLYFITFIDNFTRYDHV